MTINNTHPPFLGIIIMTYHIMQRKPGIGTEKFTISGITGTSLNILGVDIDSSYNTYFGGKNNNIPFVGKLNSDGVKQWVYSLNASNASNGSAVNNVVTDSSGNIYISGFSATSQTFLVKMNSAQVIQWQKEINGTDTQQDISSRVEVDSSGNVYLSGSWYSTSHGGFVPFIIKFNSSGGQSWTKDLSYGSNASATVKIGVDFDSSGNVYVSYFTSNTSAGVFGVAIRKMNSSGTSQWVRFITAAGERTDLVVDASGNVYVVVFRNSNNSIGILKYDTSGTLQWQRQVVGVDTSSAQNASIDLDPVTQMLYISAAYQIPSSSSVILKYNTSGALQWQRKVTGGTNGGEFISQDNISVEQVTGRIVAGLGNGVFKLRSDGTGLGTYGSYTYSATTLTESAGGATSSTVTDTQYALSVSISTPTFALTDITGSVTVSGNLT